MDRDSFWRAACGSVFAVLAIACVGEVKHDGAVAPEDVAAIKLIDSEVGLPLSASDVWFYERDHVVDSQKIRFDAPLADARAFARSALGRDLVPGEDPTLQFDGPEVEWWPKEFPQGAEGGDKRYPSPAVKIVLLPTGGTARVWVSVFTD